MSKKAVIIRVQCSLGTARFSFTSLDETFGALQKKIEEKWKVATESQILSYTPFTNPKFIEAKPHHKLGQIHCHHGIMLHLSLSKNQLATASKVVKPNPLLKMKKSTVTLATSKYVNEVKVEEKPPKYRPFHDFIEERQTIYAKTPWNIDPPKFNYKPKIMGKSVAKSSLPENAILRHQKYRHVDGVEFADMAVFGKFKRNWENSGTKKQHAALLVGRYKKVANPMKVGRHKNDVRWPAEILRAQILTYYEPNQIHQPRGVVFQADDMHRKAIAVARAMDMEIVGWMITSEERGDIILSGAEVIQAARMQNKFKNFGNYSRFVTVVVYPGNKEPRGYMISDQGCALKAYDLIGQAPDPKNYGLVRAKKAQKNVYFPTIVNQNKTVQQGEDFPPDYMIVDCLVTAAKNQSNRPFNFLKFPHPTREAKPAFLRAHLEQYKAQPYHSALSDFYLLLYLTRHMDLEIVTALAAYVAKRQRVSKDLQLTLDKHFKSIF